MTIQHKKAHAYQRYGNNQDSNYNIETHKKDVQTTNRAIDVAQRMFDWEPLPRVSSSETPPLPFLSNNVKVASATYRREIVRHVLENRVVPA